MPHRGRTGVAVLLALALAGCSAGSSTPPASPARLTVPTPTATTPRTSDASPSVALSASVTSDGLVLVALGDSASTGHGDPSGGGWVEYYAGLIEEGLGRPVTVSNRARDGTTSEQLLSVVTTDATLRAEIADADAAP
jgi:hypothetical protein